ncbi:hypothetical protein G6M84_14685 [Agrobacterium tumefaciens]|uniref:hypothetical protein n=2 Tax=Rhizobiaceae TaxID=82115 RepID=UPI001571A836|nr:hypothetical protein [Agrobacterium tumefaciens]NTB97730.1 hypothetical protein [Agrobacterium tumefaciens]NTC47130.1 hypothetical protein [Agrobacterium tumefaciens]
MVSFIKSTFFFWPILVASGCSQQPDAATTRQEMARNICKSNVPNVDIKTYTNIQGSTIHGDVTNSTIYRTYPWATAIYITRKPSYTRTNVGMTVQTVCQPFYGCQMVPMQTMYQSQESLAEVYGMARVPVADQGSAEAIAEAETQAEENCDQAAEQFAQARGKSRHSLPYTLACVRLAASVCSF